MKKIPAAIGDQACLIGMTGKTVYIECDTRKEAEELFEFLSELTQADLKDD